MNDKELLNEAKEVIKEQSEILDRLSQAANPIGTLLAKLGDGRALIAAGNGISTVQDVPSIKVGATIVIEGQSGQILAELKKPPQYGDVFQVVSVLPSGSIEFSFNSTSHVALPGDLKDLKRGDRVLLDQSRTICMEVVERAVAKKVKLTKPVRWDDIGGNTEAKQLLIEAIELPRKHPKVFQAYGHKPACGFLLYGPHGCGKTMLGKAVASALANGPSGGFFSIKGPEVLDPYVGVTEATIRDLYSQANAFYEEHKHEAVIFIDEADALLSARGRHGNYMGQTVVPTFLTAMDGLESSRVITILSTNRPDVLDPAIIRDGRITHKIEVGRPSVEEAEVIIDIHMNGTKTACDGLSKLAAERLYTHQLPHSGAMCEGVVVRAKSSALRRDVKDGKIRGVTHEDVILAVSQTVKQETQTAQYRS